jgi:F0F1-type ATP synthase membrane subunit b/b'
MKGKTISDEGIAYGWLMIAMFLVFGAILYVLITPSVNSITDEMNNNIADGVISEETSNAYNFNLQMFMAVPMFLLLGLLMYGVIRALNRKNQSAGEV